MPSMSGRTLKTRISEHYNDIRRNTSNHSVITKYRLDLNHGFAWEGTEIIDQKQFLYKRRISEMLFSCKKNSLNLQSDTEFLHHSYISILNNLH